MQAELTQLRDAIATEKRERLVRLEAADGRVQGLVRRFREAASLTGTEEASPQVSRSVTVTVNIALCKGR